MNRRGIESIRFDIDSGERGIKTKGRGNNGCRRG